VNGDPLAMMANPPLFRSINRLKPKNGKREASRNPKTKSTANNTVTNKTNAELENVFIHPQNKQTSARSKDSCQHLVMCTERLRRCALVAACSQQFSPKQPQQPQNDGFGLKFFAAQTNGHFQDF
jgi:hypothetical protein